MHLQPEDVLDALMAAAENQAKQKLMALRERHSTLTRKLTGSMEQDTDALAGCTARL